MPFPTGVKAHDAAVLAAEAIRQAAQTVPGLTQAAAHAADVAYHQACLASAKVNNPSVVVFYQSALLELGVR